MKGALDDDLKWPLHGKVNVFLLSRDDTKKHHLCQICFVGESCFDRLRLSEVSADWAVVGGHIFTC